MPENKKQKIPIPTREELEQFIRYNETHGEVMEMAIKQFSSMLRVRYVSLRESGFTEAQAMDIIKSRGVL